MGLKSSKCCSCDDDHIMKPMPSTNTGEQNKSTKGKTQKTVSVPHNDIDIDIDDCCAGCLEALV